MELNKVYNEDCRETMSRMQPELIDLTVTSPPYDNLRKYNGYSFDFEGVAKDLYKVTKKGGVVVWVVGDSTVNGSESGSSFKQALYFKEIGFNLHDTMIYQKQNFTPLTHNRYEQEFEYMFVFSKGKPQTFNPLLVPSKYAGQKTWGKPKMYKDNSGALTQVECYTIADKKIPGNVFKYPVGSTTKSAQIKHPAKFPEQLAEDHILSWSNDDDIIYDPFGGSGTTATMAEKLNRKWLTSEISKEYCKIIQDRIYKQVLGDLY